MRRRRERWERVERDGEEKGDSENARKKERERERNGKEGSRE
jgi:hypothetical protein